MKEAHEGLQGRVSLGPGSRDVIFLHEHLGSMDRWWESHEIRCMYGGDYTLHSGRK